MSGTHQLDAARRAELAHQLRALHVPGLPLVLPNAWDVASAQSVERAGFPAVATASSAIAASLGYEDGEGAPMDEMFAAIQRIARAVRVPVTADVEAGYGLAGEELAERLIGAGAVGCNLEDSSHPDGGLIDVATQRARIRALRDAATEIGVPVVINARVDVHAREIGDPAARTDVAIARGRHYRDAGADCIYPIMVIDEPTIVAFVAAFDGMINVYARPEAPALARLAELGVARVSYGPWIHRLALRRVDQILADVARGVDPY